MNDPQPRDLSAASDLLKPFDAGLEAALSRERPDQPRGERRRGMRPRPAFERRSGEVADVVKILPLL
jgi:hypothetical protein